MEARLLTAQVVKVLSHRFGDGRMPDIEAIQDVVEQTLIAANHFETARAYIVYREQHRTLRRPHAPWWTWPPPSTSTWTAPTGGSPPTPTRAIRWAG